MKFISDDVHAFSTQSLNYTYLFDRTKLIKSFIKKEILLRCHMSRTCVL